MNEEERSLIESEALIIMKASASDEYAGDILNSEYDKDGNTIMGDVISDVMETSSWKEDGRYNEDDIILAIGRTLMNRLGFSR